VTLTERWKRYTIKSFEMKLLIFVVGNSVFDKSVNYNFRVEFFFWGGNIT